MRNAKHWVVVGRPTAFLGLRSPTPNPMNSINSNMAEQQANPLQPIPPELDHLIHLNVEFRVLVCLGNGCRKAVSARGFVEHLRKIHKEKPPIRKKVYEYTEGFPHDYDYSNIQLPNDGLLPQPVIPIVDGFQCKDCGFKTQDHSNIRKHGNKVHNKKRIPNNELFQAVRLQSWFRDGKERYWIVDEGREGEQRENPQQSRTHQVLG